MLQWFRARARSIAAVSLVSLATLSVWSATPHQDDCHDAICASVVVPHDPSAHSIGRDSSETDRPLHCVLCHWTRIVRPSTGASHHIAPSLERNVRTLVDIVSSPQCVLRGAASASRTAVLSSSRRVARVLVRSVRLQADQRETRSFNPFIVEMHSCLYVGFYSACVVLAAAVALSPHVAAQVGTRRFPVDYSIH